MMSGVLPPRRARANRQGVAMKGKARLAFAGLGALAALSLGPVRAPAAETTQTLTTSFTANGPTVILDKWSCWFGADCRYAPCHMTTVSEPRLGRLTPDVGSGAIPSAGGRCMGKPVPVLTIVYTPRPGAHGADEVVLRSNSDNGSRHVLNIHVEVP
jgi:hypothetical protein